MLGIQDTHILVVLMVQFLIASRHLQKGRIHFALLQITLILLVKKDDCSWSLIFNQQVLSAAVNHQIFCQKILLSTF